MSIIQTLEVDSPFITKTDVMHSVKNNTENVRLVAVVRWSLTELDYEEIEDVLELECIKIDSQ